MDSVMNKDQWPGLFISKEKTKKKSGESGRVLLFSSRSLKTVILSNLEYLLFESYLGSENETTVTNGLSAVLAKTYPNSNRNWEASLQRFVKSMKRDKFLAQGPVDTGIRYPEKALNLKTIYIHLSDKCNLTCTYCYNMEYRDEHRCASTRLTDTEIYTLIDDALAMGAKTFTFTGGEPLLHKSCLKFGHYISQHEGCFSELLTNGMLIERVGAKKIMDAFNMVIVSLDSQDLEIHERQRGKDSFDKTVAGIDALCAIDPDRVVLRPVVHAENVDAYETFVHWAKDRFGVTRVNASLYTPNSMEEAKSTELLVSTRQCGDMVQANERITEMGEVSVDMDYLNINRGCGAGGSILSIGANGEVFACQAMHHEGVQAGNIRDNSLAHIAKNGSSLKQMRTMNPNKIKDCDKCSLNPICGGGCRANVYAIYKDLYTRNALLCANQAKQAELLLWKQAQPIGHF